MRQDYSEFTARNAAVIVIGPDNAEGFRKYWQENSLPYFGLADPGSRTAKRFGQEVNLLKLGRMPAVFVIDKAGVIRYAYYGQSMSDIPPNYEVLRALDEI